MLHRSGMNTKRVCYFYPPAYHYRGPFNDRLRDALSAHGVEYSVVYSDLGKANRFKNDTIEIPWGKKVGLIGLPLGFVYQRALRIALGCDLVIVQQESKLALNYIMNLSSMLGLKKVAFFGHGRNFQSRQQNGMGERFKRFWATKVDWWFGYTDETRRHIEALGFPPERITVFNNAVDTSEVRTLVAAMTPERLAVRRSEVGITSEHVGVFVGSLYPDRRLPFLIDAADAIRAQLPDFELVVAGGGVDLPLLQKLAASRPWIKVMGPRFGADKVELMMLGTLFLMPGLVGLAVVDAGAAGLPTITTAFPYHSPEIAYIDEGSNGLIVADWENPVAYSEAVVGLLCDADRLAAMRAAAGRTAESLTIEAMADRFAGGVLKALGIAPVV
jgi:glycosyltransferase involved in cell wall biosynthesis